MPQLNTSHSVRNVFNIKPRVNKLGTSLFGAIFLSTCATFAYLCAALYKADFKFCLRAAFNEPNIRYVFTMLVALYLLGIAYACALSGPLTGRRKTATYVLSLVGLHLIFTPVFLWYRNNEILSNTHIADYAIFSKPYLSVPALFALFMMPFAIAKWPKSGFARRIAPHPVPED